jgi:hypothetical protein
MSTTQIIESQTDLNRLFDSVVEDFRALSFQQLFITEQQMLAELHQGYFLSATGPDGSKWPPLATSTIERKGHNTILVDTGRLVGSLNKGTGGGDAIRETVDEFAGAGAGYSYGTAVPYSMFHDQGLGQKQRQHIGINDNYFAGIVDRSMDFALEGLTQ